MWLGTCGYHGNYYVGGYENSHDFLMDSNQYDEMDTYLFDHLFHDQNFSYYNLDLPTIEMYLKQGIKPIHIQR